MKINLSDERKFWLSVLVLFLGLVIVFIGTIANAETQLRQGRLIQFDFALLDAPLVTGIQAKNLKCRQLSQYQFNCYDVMKPEILVPYNTQPSSQPE